jgi:hypothetical protein
VVIVMTKRPRCAWCKKAFTPPKQGRPPRFCSAAHRQRAYELRRARAMLPQLLLDRDIDGIRGKDGIKRAVVAILRELGFLPALPKRLPPLRIVRDPADRRSPK